jgi:hypothetical protein
MRSLSQPSPAHRGSSLAAVLCLAVAGAGVAACCDAQGEPPDLAQAERELENARDELEEIVGARLLGLEPPPIPELPRPKLAPAESELVDRLDETPPGEWTADERARLGAVLARELPRVSAIGSRGDVVTTERLLSSSVPILQASRLLSLRDRLHLLDGREAELLDGLELRTEVGLRLALQPNLVGPLVATAVQRQVLDDLRWTVLRPETDRTTLERLDALLLHWRLEAPDAAASLARETLASLDGTAPREGAEELAADDPTRALFTAPWAEAAVEVARGCREGDCRAGIAALRIRPGEDGNPYDVIAELMIPNLVDAVRKLDDARTLSRLAHVAVGLRLEAAEAGAYPSSAEAVAARLGLTPAQADAIVYELRPDGGARLGLASDRIVADAHALHRELLGHLSAWDLPRPLVSPADEPAQPPR